MKVIVHFEVEDCFSDCVFCDSSPVDDLPICLRSMTKLPSMRDIDPPKWCPFREKGK